MTCEKELYNALEIHVTALKCLYTCYRLKKNRLFDTKHHTEQEALQTVILKKFMYNF